MKHVDVIVIGGGAAGMMAAGRAAEFGRSVVLLEKNSALGKKLNLTGGGRCNLTNAVFDNRALLANYGDAAKFLFSPFSRFSVRDTFDFFEGRDLPLVVEERACVFPQSQKATDVTRVLTEYMLENEVQLAMNTEVLDLVAQDQRVVSVKTSHGDFSCESLVIATGGASYKNTGSTGDGFRWLKALGHTVADPNPDVVPLRVKDEWVKALAGITLENMRIEFCAADGQKVTRTGRLLFTHFGISGPLILNCAHEVKKLMKQGAVATTINLFPELEIHQLDRHILAAFDDNKNKQLRNVIKSLVPPGMARAVEHHCTAEILAKKVNTVSQAERRMLVTLLAGLPFSVTGTMGYDWAVVCDGGVEMTEIDTRTMASRLVPNLFIVGDLLNITRPSGGFSLQLCWTTGRIAGESA